MKKTLIVSLGMVIILIAGYFVMQKTYIQKKISRSTEKLTFVTTINTPGLTLFHIAKNKGYFMEEAVDITYKKAPNGFDALTDALKGDSDIALGHETPVVRKIYSGEKVSIISTMHTSTKSMGIVGKKNKGIY